MNRKLLAASAFVVTALLLPPAGAEVEHKHYGQKEGEFCRCGATQCYDDKNEMWVCKAADANSCKWHTTGVCTNNLKPGEDINKNAEKEKQAGEERRKANEKRTADEKKAADDKKRADEKRAADDKKKADEKKAAEDRKKADEKKAAEAKKAKEQKDSKK